MNTIEKVSLPKHEKQRKYILDSLNRSSKFEENLLNNELVALSKIPLKALLKIKNQQRESQLHRSVTEKNVTFSAESLPSKKHPAPKKVGEKPKMQHLFYDL